MLHVLIGRNADCDFRLKNGSVSRTHAVLRAKGERLILEDQNSRNGTFIKRGQLWQHIDRAEVAREDRVRFGEQEADVAEILASGKKRPRIGAGGGASRQRIGQKAGSGTGTGTGGNEKPLKKFVRPRRNQVTGDIEEGG